MLALTTPVGQINKIGAATAKKLAKLEIKTVQDLLQYYPFRYEDYSQTAALKDLKPGLAVNVRGEIDFIQNKRSFRQKKMITEALINDGSGQLKIVWFNQPFIGRSLKVGDSVSLAGTVQSGMLGLEMISPEYEKIGQGKLVHTNGFVPVYHLTGNLTNRQVRFLIKSIIGAASQIEDSLPQEIIKKYQLLGLAEAINNIHFPLNLETLGRARRRLQFDELFLVQLRTQIKKSEIRNQKSEIIKFFKEETNKFVKQLPFQLTAAQKKAAWEILQDLEKNQPMARLLEGDVGSGKTVTAALAMLNVALNKKQSALLVPTEILAAQHYETLIKLFKGVDINIGLFTRSQQKIFSVIASLPAGRQGVTSPIGTTKQSRGSIDKQRDCFAPSHKNATGLAMTKKEMTAEIKDGKIDIIVGTHALLQEDIEFRDLALAIIDEQHRFGVAQRQTLRHKSGAENIMPHLLSMTATPIPRSLAQVIYGDLDLSIINELPKGRKKIATFLVPEFKRAGAYDFIKKEIASGRQAFVVCPLISPSDKLGVKSVEEEYKKLNEHIFPELKIGCLHGKLKPAEKEKIMSAFASSNAPSDFEIFDGKKVSKNEEASADKQNRIDILVSTSVIEVGVDVPNASVMMIEGAERFGLAQLHQFRGRVGRSAHQSYCLLFTRTLENDGHKLTYENLSRMPNENKTVVASKKVWGFTDSLNEQTRARLAVFTKNSDGFKLAAADLKQRGPGEVYGTAQAGFPEFKIATLNDLQLIKETKEAAEQIVIGGIDKYPRLLERVKQEGEYVAG